jgi:hypothetical protein
MFVNPIVVLAGACANNGMSMFANELLSQGRGNRDCKAIRKGSKRMSGMHLTTVARVMDDKAKCGTL